MRAAQGLNATQSVGVPPFAAPVSAVLQSDGDIRDLPLIERKARLRDILIDLDDDRLRYSEEFSDPARLLSVAEKMGLEGVVSKRKDRPYRSGNRSDWVKVKTPSWREANKNRFEELHNKGKVHEAG
jgi:bifunctional non-homologous end joining protein LigD